IAGNSLRGEPEIGGPVGDEPVELHEAALIEQEIEPFAGGELSLLVLLRDALRATTLFGQGLAMPQVFEEFTWFRHGRRIYRPASPAGLDSRELPPDVDDDCRLGLKAAGAFDLGLDVECPQD